MLPKVSHLFRLFLAVGLILFMMADQSAIDKVTGGIGSQIIGDMIGAGLYFGSLYFSFVILCWIYDDYPLRRLVGDFFCAESAFDWFKNLSALFVLVMAHRFFEYIVVMPFIGVNAFIGLFLIVAGLIYLSLKHAFRGAKDRRVAQGVLMMTAAAMEAETRDFFESLDDNPSSSETGRGNPGSPNNGQSSAAFTETKEDTTGSTGNISRLKWFFKKLGIALLGLPCIYGVSTFSNDAKAAFSAGEYLASLGTFGLAGILAIPSAWLVAKFFGVPITEFFKTKLNGEAAGIASSIFD